MHKGVRMTNGKFHHSHAPDSPPAATPGFPIVARLLGDQLQLYQELDQLSQAQSGLISEERTDELLRVLARREMLIGRIQGLNDSLSGVRARWSEFVAGLDEAQRDSIGERVAGITRIIEAVSQRDNADRDLLRGKCDQVSGELSGLDRSRRAAAAYGPGRPGGHPLFQDREA